MSWLLTFRYRFREVGANFYCGHSLFVRPETVRVGKDVFIGSECHLAVCELTIGDHVMFAPRVAVVGGDHNFGIVGTPIRATGRGEEKKVTIEDDVWIGYGSTIMQGITLEEGCVIAAGSIVTKNVPAYTVWAGVPAKYIRDRFREESDKFKHSQIIGGKYHES